MASESRWFRSCPVFSWWSLTRLISSTPPRFFPLCRTPKVCRVDEACIGSIIDNFVLHEYLTSNVSAVQTSRVSIASFSSGYKDDERFCAVYLWNSHPRTQTTSFTREERSYFFVHPCSDQNCAVTELQVNYLCLHAFSSNDPLPFSGTI